MRGVGRCSGCISRLGGTRWDYKPREDAGAEGRGQRSMYMAGREESRPSQKGSQEDAGLGDGLRHVVKELEGFPPGVRPP